jgi:hypothetical protein
MSHENVQVVRRFLDRLNESGVEGGLHQTRDDALRAVGLEE